MRFIHAMSAVGIPIIKVPEDGQKLVELVKAYLVQTKTQESTN